MSTVIIGIINCRSPFDADVKKAEFNKFFSNSEQPEKAIYFAEQDTESLRKELIAIFGEDIKLTVIPYGNALEGLAAGNMADLAYGEEVVTALVRISKNDRVIIDDTDGDPSCYYDFVFLEQMLHLRGIRHISRIGAGEGKSVPSEFLYAASAFVANGDIGPVLKLYRENEAVGSLTDQEEKILHDCGRLYDSLSLCRGSVAVRMYDEVVTESVDYIQDKSRKKNPFMYFILSLILDSWGLDLYHVGNGAETSKALIRMCLNKGLYQQALTLFDERVPVDAFHDREMTDKKRRNTVLYMFPKGFNDLSREEKDSFLCMLNYMEGFFGQDPDTEKKLYGKALYLMIDMIRDFTNHASELENAFGADDCLTCMPAFLEKLDPSLIGNDSPLYIAKEIRNISEEDGRVTLPGLLDNKELIRKIILTAMDATGENGGEWSRCSRPL